MSESLPTEARPVAPRSTRAMLARVLIIDDSTATRNQAIESLRVIERVEVLVAQGGLDGVRAVKDGGVSLVICDYDMPGMNGLQVLKLLRSMHTAVELPVLMFTANEDEQVKIRLLRAGANDFVAKHASPEELLARVGTQLELLDAQRQLLESRAQRSEHQKFEAIGQLAESLAHELNTPAQYLNDNLAFLAEGFSSLCALAEALRTDPSFDAARVAELLASTDYAYFAAQMPRCMTESRQGVEHVVRIVRTVREFARPGAHELARHNVNDLLRGATEIMRGQWAQVARLELELDETLGPVECVLPAINRIVLQLMMNAVKAMTDESAASELGVLRICSARQDDWFVLEISDTGRGIDHDALQSMLRPAVGLAIPEYAPGLRSAERMIVDDHGGRFEVRRVAPRGTSVVIHLPFASH